MCTALALVVGFAMSCGGKATEPHDGGVVEWGEVSVPEAAVAGPDGTAADARHADAGLARDSEGRPPQLPSDAPTNQGPNVVSVVLISSASTLRPGEVVTFNVRAVYDDATTRDVVGSIALTTSDESIVMLAGNQGVAFAVGVATITATVDGIVAGTSITVTDSEVVAIAVSTDRAALWAARPNDAPASALSLASRTSANFYARARMSDGSDRDVTYAALWASSTPNVVMQPGGQAYGWSAGKAVVSATLGGARGELEVDVEGAQVVDYVIAGEGIMPPMTVATFALYPVYSDGVLGGDPIAADWQSSDPAVLATSPGDANTTHASAGMLGPAVLTARSGSASASMKVVVSNATLQSVQIIPARLELSVRGTAKITVMGTYTDGTVVDVTDKAGWTVDPLVFVQDGIISARAAGTAWVTAHVDPAPASEPATVTVRAGTPTGILLDHDVSIPQGFSIACSALASYEGAEDRFEIGGDVIWQTGDAAIASAAGSRLLGGSVGRTVYSALVGSVRSNERAVTVTAAKLLRIGVLEPIFRVMVNEPRELRVHGIFDDGSAFEITPHATFSTADAQIASVSNAPTSKVWLRGTGVGTTAVTATVNGVTVTTPVTVTTDR